MKLLLKTGATALALALSAQAAAAEEKVVVYHWFEYIPQELLDKFTAETGIEVVMDTYDSNEALLASLKAGAIGHLRRGGAGRLHGQDHVGRRNAGHDRRRRAGEQRQHSAAMAGRRVSTRVVSTRSPISGARPASRSTATSTKATSATTDILFNPPEELKGKINMLDSQGEVMALASLHMGIPQCTTDRDQLKALNDMLQAAKGNWISFNSDTAKEVLVSGDAAAGMVYNGFSAKAREEGANVEYAYPEQGYIVWMDNVVLLKDAPNRANAFKFMDFLLEPENIAAVTNYAQYAAGVDGVTEFLDEALRTQPESNPPAEVTGVFVEACEEEIQAVYDTIWTNLKK